MVLYKANNGSLEQIKEKPFKYEKEIQRVFEQNLSTIMGLELVKSEFVVKNKRIDTLAFDNQSNAFVIIEYKRNKNSSVVDQGFTYLSLMLQNKSDFILEYNEVLGKTLARDKVDWSQTKVIFVSSDFTENQIEATNFKDLAIELWEIKQYSNGTVIITPIRKSKSAESIKPIAQKNNDYKSVTDEIKVYNEDDLLQGKSEETIELYDKFKTAILNLSDGIELKPLKWYVTFKKDGKNIANIEIMKTSIKLGICVKKGVIDDPKHILRDVANIGHLGTGDYEVKISDDNNLEYLMSIVKQAL